MADENGEKPSSLHGQNDEASKTQAEEAKSQVSTESTRYLKLKNRKKSAKSRLTKTRNHLAILTTGSPGSKTEIRRAIKKVKAEGDIIEKIVHALKETVVLSEETLEETDTEIIDNLDHELAEILDLVDKSVKEATDHIKERLLNGENESEVSTIPPSSKVSVDSKVTKSSHGSPHKSVEKSVVEMRQQEARDAGERLERLEGEQRVLEQELQKKSETFELNKQRIQDARSIAILNENRAKHAQVSGLENNATKDASAPSLASKQNFPKTIPPHQASPVGSFMRVKLKGVELPTFSGENKTEYEAWSAAFTSMVDDTDMPVKEKMLRLQNCLRGKALETVRDLGYSSYAYEKAKEKLKRKYGGKRRQTLTHMATLRGLSKVRRHNLEDMEELLAVLDRILVALQESDHEGEMKSRHLGLTVKEKLPEEYVREYKYWLLEQDAGDDFENLVEWIERRVRIMDEAREETGEFDRRRNQKDGERRHHRGYNSSGKVRGCVVTKCKSDHPPWVCPEFKKLSVNQRKELISKSGRCFRCLAAGHNSKNCTRSRKCGVDGCESYGHSNYLHDPAWKSTRNDNLHDEEVPGEERVTLVSDVTSNDTNTFTTGRVEQISLMVLPAVIENGARKLNVNVMLDPCSSGSYITESAAEELQLKGDRQNLTISWTGGTTIKKQSKRVQCSVVSLNGSFSARVEANVLDNITGNTPAIESLEGTLDALNLYPFSQSI